MRLKVEPATLNRTALIISPFATHPLDAGHRRRTHQVTKLLKDAGYRITYLLFAFEDQWYWRHDEAVLQELRNQWDEVIVVYAQRGVGGPPKNGVSHSLDEWWDPDLEAVLRNLSGRRVFDVAVVHNVWLTKAFDFLPSRTVRVLETHDIFWKRSEAFACIGQAAEFFICDKATEVFGIRRAQVVVAIQQKEGAELLRETGTDVVTVPFYDADLEHEAAAIRRNEYHAPDKVSFGMLGSANAFNIHGLRALATALEERIGRTFAPVELVIGGRVGQHLTSSLYVRQLGVVPTEAAFYKQVDYAIAPVFHGTGFKIKTADALALDMPSLFSRHSAEGAELDDAVVFDTPEAMADQMIELSLRRPAIAETRAHVSRARRIMRAGAAAGAKLFLDNLRRRLKVLVIDLSFANPVSDALVLQGFLSQIRVFGDRCPLVLLLSPETLRIAGRLLPPSVEGMTLADFRTALDQPDRPRVTVLDVSGRPGSVVDFVGPEDEVLWDQRWAVGGERSGGVFGEMPVFHSNLKWERSSTALRDAFEPKPGGTVRRVSASERLIFVDGEIPTSPLSGIPLGNLPNAIHVRADDWSQMQPAMMSLHRHRPQAVVWAAATRGVGYRAVMELCGLLHIPFQGFADNAFFRKMAPLPTRLSIEQDRKVGDVFNAIMKRRASSGITS